MAVYKRSYKAYEGRYTPEWSRLFAIPRFAWRNLSQSRFLTIFYVICFFFPLVCALGIYLNSNLVFLSQYVSVPKDGILSVNGKFFLVYTNVQGVFAFLLTAFVGPGLISPDLVNGGLPLYFCRPFSRTEYVLGKLIALAAPLSLITWIPGLLLWALHAGVTDDWWSGNLWLAGSIFASSWVWIGLIAVLALAMSAWVKWRIVAGALMLVVLFLASGFAAAINAAMRTENGYWIDVWMNLERVSMALYGVDLPDDVFVEQCAVTLLATMGLCLWLLTRKVKAFEVVR